MWYFEVQSGRLAHDDEGLVAVGYSGAVGFKNDVHMEDVKDAGPIPGGFYTIEAPVDSQAHGPFSLPLVPDAGNDMFGRSGFLIHGDSREHPGAASEGCVILARATRERIWESGDHRLQVTNELAISA
jgi:Tlde1 domain